MNDGTFPGLRKLNRDIQVKVIETLYVGGFFGNEMTLDDAIEVYADAPLLTHRLRCAMPERAASGECKWPMKDVTFRQSLDLPGLTQEQVKQCYEEACASWNAVCGVRLVLVQSGEYVNIDAQSGYIDGSSGTLAYSYVPCNVNENSCMGQVYDDREDWDYAWLREVAAHEIGHAIGLDHSPDPDALMYPYSHGGRITGPQEWDIEEAIARYGLPVDPPPVPEPPEGGDGTGVVVIEGNPHLLRLKGPGTGPGLGGGVFILDGVSYEIVVLT